MAGQVTTCRLFSFLRSFVHQSPNAVPGARILARMSGHKSVAVVK